MAPSTCRQYSLSFIEVVSSVVLWQMWTDVGNSLQRRPCCVAVILGAVPRRQTFLTRHRKHQIKIVRRHQFWHPARWGITDGRETAVSYVWFDQHFNWHFLFILPANVGGSSGIWTCHRRPSGALLHWATRPLNTFLFLGELVEGAETGTTEL